MTAAGAWAAPAPSPPDDWPVPPRCAYCGAGRPAVVCELEHDAWIGERLCGRCYAAVCAEVPVLPGRGRPQRRSEGDAS